MENIISVLGVVAGLVSLVATIAKEVRFTLKVGSIEIKFGHGDRVSELKIENIKNLSDAEIKYIVNEIQNLESKNGGERRDG